MLRLYDYFYYKAGSNANRRTRDPAHCAASVEAAGKKLVWLDIHCVLVPCNLEIAGDPLHVY